MATVLVVDDEFGIVDVLETILTDEGYRVLTACNGKQGLMRLSYGSPDISGPECTFYRSPRFDSRHPYRAGKAAAQATAQSERTRLWLLANRVQAISQASRMPARPENTELASQ